VGLSVAPATPEEQGNEEEEGGSGGDAGEVLVCEGRQGLMLLKRGTMDVLDLFAVFSAEGVPADDGDLFQHFHAVFEVAHSGTRVVAPAYGDFHHFEAGLESDEEDLGIEAPALDGLELEDGLGGVAGEGFEAALGVGKVESHDSAGDGIEAAAKELAIERLAVSLAAFFKPARADGYIRSLGDGGKQALGLVHGSGQVGVGKHDHFAKRLKEAGANAVAFSAVAGVIEDADFRGGAGKVEDHLAGGVGGAVVDDDDLGIPLVAANAADNVLKRRRDAGAFIEGRDDDAEVGVVGHGIIH